MRLTCCAVVLALLLSHRDAAADHKSETPGPKSGSFGQAIPIDVPAFRGLEPRLALSYSSEGGNGLAGVGWNLAGFSAIERAKPGRGTPRYDANDIYLLDGQELIPCPPGSVSPSCTTGGSHTTKNETYQRFLYESQSNTWSVWSKDGTRTIYTSVYEVPSSGTLRWGQASVVDPRGNTVSYVWEFANGDCYPSAVVYGSYAVTLFRETRPDITKFAIGVASSLGETNARLRSILIKRGGSPIRAYKLSYIVSGSTGRSLLAAVQQFGRDVAIDANGVITGGTSLPARTFVYQEDPAARTFDAPNVTVTSTSACHPTCNVTFTAAGADSYYWSGCASGTGGVKTCQITSMATITATVTGTNGDGTSASASASVQPANQTPSITNPGNKTWPKNTDVSFQFTVTDDDPASTGSCVNYVVPVQVGVKQGCAYWQGSKWQADLHTSTTAGTGTISWTYKDQWGAPVSRSFTATVQ